MKNIRRARVTKCPLSHDVCNDLHSINTKNVILLFSTVTKFEKKTKFRRRYNNTTRESSFFFFFFFYNIIITTASFSEFHESERARARVWSNIFLSGRRAGYLIFFVFYFSLCRPYRVSACPRIIFGHKNNAYNASRVGRSGTIHLLDAASRDHHQTSLGKYFSLSLSRILPHTVFRRRTEEIAV